MMILDAAGPEQIRTGLHDAAATVGERAGDVNGLALGLGEAAAWYESLQMAPTTVEHLRDAVADLDRAANHLRTSDERLQAALTDFDNRDGRVADAVAATGNLMDPGESTNPISTNGSTADSPAQKEAAPVASNTDETSPAKPSGRPPQQPDAAGALWIDPADGSEVRGRIVNRTKTSADIEWPNGHVEKHVKFTDPAKYGTFQWLTQEQLDAEQAATRWPERVRSVDGLVGIQRDDDNGVTITAGTVQQVAGIDPDAWRHRTAERYAYFGQEEELPKLRRALGAAARAAGQGKPYRKMVDGADIGDVELTVVPQAHSEPAVTVTVRPYSDISDLEDWKQTTEADFGEVPDEIEDDDNDGRTRPLTAEERAGWQADIRADYERWKAENPPPAPLVVTLTVPMVDRLRDQLARTGPADQDGPA